MGATWHVRDVPREARHTCRPTGEPCFVCSWTGRSGCALGRLLQVSLPHQGTRLRFAPPGALPGSGCARAPAFGPLGAAAADARPQLDRPGGMRREPSPRLQEDASGGGATAPGWRWRRSRVPVGAGRALRGLPSRPPSTQAEPSSRGPGRKGRSYSGALHLDALNHDRSTECGSKADGMGAQVSGGLRGAANALPQPRSLCHTGPAAEVWLQGGGPWERLLGLWRWARCS